MREITVLENTPNGLSEIIRVFGSLDDPEFEAKYIRPLVFPYPLKYNGLPVNRGRSHYLIIENLELAFSKIKEKGLTDQVTNYGGIYQPRSQRGSTHPSTHSWGITIDLEPEKYPLGSTDRFSDEIVQIFKDAGFFYGGDFEKRLDPMHFQFASSY
jgi:hypothetical protein